MDCSNPFQKSLRFESLALKPPSRSAPAARKWFATIEIVRMSCDLDWLDKAFRTMVKQIQEMNQKRRGKEQSGMAQVQ